MASLRRDGQHPSMRLHWGESRVGGSRRRAGQPIIMGGVAPNAGRRWRSRVPAGTRAAAVEVTAPYQFAELDCAGTTWVNRAVARQGPAVISGRRLACAPKPPDFDVTRPANLGNMSRTLAADAPAAPDTGRSPRAAAGQIPSFNFCRTTTGLGWIAVNTLDYYGNDNNIHNWQLK